MFITKTLGRYFLTACERHNIYRLRLEGEPWPWTSDPIFSTFKFTNVYRQLDLGTKWLTHNWIIPYASHPLLFFNICLYRQFNWIPTADYLGFVANWDGETVYELLKIRRDAKLQLYTNAHMVRGPIEIDGTKEKLKYTVYNILDVLYANLPHFSPQPGDSLQTAFNRLVKAYGFGGFVTYEVISDLRWTRYLMGAEDTMTWANAGPGAIRGLNRLLGQPVKKSMSQTKAVELMRELLEMSPRMLTPDMPAWEMREVEHWLCEFDKYERVRLGEGRPRVKFVPPHARKQHG